MIRSASLRSRAAGLTRYEWMAFLVLSGLMIAFAVPRFLDRDRIGREQAAMHALDIIRESESTFRAMRVIDEDGDGLGEFAGFRILCDPLALAALPRERQSQFRFGEPVAGEPELRVHNGYVFRVFVPRAASQDGINKREELFLAAAWPMRWKQDGARCFLLSAAGTLYVCESQAAAGVEAKLELESIFATPFDMSTLDTNIWRDTAAPPADNAPEPDPARP